MVSRLLRRSGVAVGQESARLGWTPDCLIQVGVGGYHQEIDVLKEEWPEMKFLGFEPLPDIVKGIKDYPGELREIAISDECGEGEIYVKNRHKDGTSVFPFNDDIKIRKILPVKTDTLDNQIPKLDVFGKDVILWLDCEGSELRALGGAETLLKSIKMVNVEMTPSPPSMYWPTPNEIHNVLHDAGFYRQCLHTMKGGQYDAIYVKKEIFQAKYCCCPFTVTQFENDMK